MPEPTRERTVSAHSAHASPSLSQGACATLAGALRMRLPQIISTHVPIFRTVVCMCHSWDGSAHAIFSTLQLACATRGSALLMRFARSSIAHVPFSALHCALVSLGSAGRLRQFPHRRAHARFPSPLCACGRFAPDSCCCNVHVCFCMLIVGHTPTHTLFSTPHYSCRCMVCWVPKWSVLREARA